MANKSNKQLIEQIQHKLQAVVPGYDSCRPAVIDLRSLNLKITSHNDDGTTEECTIETCLMMGYITVTNAKGERGWSEHESLTEKELKTIIAAIDLLKLQEPDEHLYGKYIRAYNPWWLIGDDCNKILTDIIDESYEDYIFKIKHDKHHD